MAHSCNGALEFHRRWEEDGFVLIRARKCSEGTSEASCYDATSEIEEAASWMIAEPNAGFFVKGGTRTETRTLDDDSGWTRVNYDSLLLKDLTYEPSIVAALEIGGVLHGGAP